MKHQYFKNKKIKLGSSTKKKAEFARGVQNFILATSSDIFLPLM